MVSDNIYSPKPWQHVLCFYELTEWTLTLTTGQKMVIYADGVCEEDGYLVFDTLIEGRPRPDEVLILAKVPQEIVAEYESTYVGRVTPDDP